MNQQIHSIVSTINHLVKDLAACTCKSLPESSVFMTFILCLTDELMISHCMQIGVLETLVFMTRLLMNQQIFCHKILWWQWLLLPASFKFFQCLSFTLISINSSLKKKTFIFSIPTCMLIHALHLSLWARLSQACEGSPQQCSKHSTTCSLIRLVV